MDNQFEYRFKTDKNALVIEYRSTNYAKISPFGWYRVVLHLPKDPVYMNSDYEMSDDEMIALVMHLTGCSDIVFDRNHTDLW